MLQKLTAAISSQLPLSALQTVTFKFANQKVSVSKEGYDDHYHIKPDLDKIAKDRATGNVQFLYKIRKNVRDVQTVLSLPKKLKHY